MENKQDFFFDLPALIGIFVQGIKSRLFVAGKVEFDQDASRKRTPS